MLHTNYLPDVQNGVHLPSGISVKGHSRNGKHLGESKQCLFFFQSSFQTSEIVPTAELFPTTEVVLYFRSTWFTCVSMQSSGNSAFKNKQSYIKYNSVISNVCKLFGMVIFKIVKVGLLFLMDLTGFYSILVICLKRNFITRSSPYSKPAFVDTFQVF